MFKINKLNFVKVKNINNYYDKSLNIYPTLCHCCGKNGKTDLINPFNIYCNNIDKLFTDIDLCINSNK